MKIDLEKEQPIALAEVSRYVSKRSGKKVHYSTIYRWTTKGARGRILESVMVGGIRFTTVEAVHRFLASKPTATNTMAAGLDDAIDEALRQEGV